MRNHDCRVHALRESPYLVRVGLDLLDFQISEARLELETADDDAIAAAEEAPADLMHDDVYAEPEHHAIGQKKHGLHRYVASM
jgi:hypothetical protein